MRLVFSDFSFYYILLSFIDISMYLRKIGRWTCFLRLFIIDGLELRAAKLHGYVPVTQQKRVVDRRQISFEWRAASFFCNLSFCHFLVHFE